MKHLKLFRWLVVVIALVSCKNETSNLSEPASSVRQLQLKYATGFTVNYFEDYKLLTVNKPWPNSDKELHYILTNEKDVAYPNENATIIEGNIEKLVVTSTTHIPALELLEEEKSLVGFPGTDYVSSEKTRVLIDKGAIRELGKNESLNTEVLLDLNPDVVVGFGIEGINKTFETIKNTGIPVVYNGDWVEASPLAKAEWIKFFGVLFDKEEQADSIFNTIEQNYYEAKSLAKSSTQRPTVLSGAMHKDIWYLPNGSSAEGQLMADANLNYLWKNTKGKGSLALSFEVVFNEAKNADIWLSPSYYTSLDQLKTANAVYANFKAFKGGSIFSFSKTVGATGGVLYYEMGTARPDLILKDLIKIGHPELLREYEPVFFKKLN